MLTRRSLLTALASLPLCGWIKPKRPEVDSLGGFLVPTHLESAIESIEGVCHGERFVYMPNKMTLNECAIARKVYLTPELARDADVMAALFKDDFDKAFKETFGCP